MQTIIRTTTRRTHRALLLSIVAIGLVLSGLMVATSAAREAGAAQDIK